VRIQLIFGTEVDQGCMVISRRGCDKSATEANKLVTHPSASEWIGRGNASIPRTARVHRRSRGMGQTSARQSVALGSVTAPRIDGAEVEAELSYSSKSDDILSRPDQGERNAGTGCEDPEMSDPRALRRAPFESPMDWQLEPPHRQLECEGLGVCSR